jgi:hypothetical protein
MTIDSNLIIVEAISNWYKKFFNWKGKLIALILSVLMFFLIHLHIAARLATSNYSSPRCNKQKIADRTWFKVSNFTVIY